MTTVSCVEGLPFEIEKPLHEPLRRAVADARRRIRPTGQLLSQDGSRFVIAGVVGALELRPGLVLEVVPKTEPEEDWVTAVLDLLLPSTRASVAGDRQGGLARHRQPLDLLASIYVRRLRRALHRDGPVLLIERRSGVRQQLVGKLDVSRWARVAAWRPQELPTSFQTLSADNFFNRGMAYAASLLADATRDPQVRGSLRRLAGELRPGAPPAFAINSPVQGLRLPPQWAGYDGAWDIALSVLSRKSLLGAGGRRQGVSVAIEIWPLLETLLTRALSEAVRLGRNHGREMSCPPKSISKLIAPLSDSAGAPRGVEPDGRLTSGPRTLATFEAKYSRGDGSNPPRQHIFQSLATAAACDSPLAVLVYPEEFDAMAWETSGFDGRPARLVSIGLGLFGYRSGEGDRSRGQRLFELLDVSGAETAVGGLPATV